MTESAIGASLEVGSGGQPGRSKQIVRSLGSKLLTYYTRASRVDRGCYLISVILFGSGLFHLGVQVVQLDQWDGPVSWRKPATFGLSFGLTLATITWVTNFVPLPQRTRVRLLSIFAAASVVEVAVITTQAWRRVPSHFNVSTSLNASFAYTAAAGGALLIITTLAFAIASIRPFTSLSPSMRLAVRAGFITFVAALAIGAVMIGTRETRTGSQSAAYTVASAFKSGHAATMHGILILPGLGWLCSFAKWDESRRIRIVAVACAGYFLTSAVVIIDILADVDPLNILQSPIISTLLAAGGIVCLLSAGGMTIARILREGLAPGFEHSDTRI